MKRIFLSLFLSMLAASPAFADGTSVAPGVSRAATVLTSTDETASYANSRRLVDGSNTTVNTSTPGQIKIDVSSSGVISVSGTANQIDSTGGTTPVLSLSSSIQLPGTSAMRVQVGTDAQRPSLTNADQGWLRCNSESNYPEWFTGAYGVSGVSQWTGAALLVSSVTGGHAYTSGGLLLPSGSNALSRPDTSYTGTLRFRDDVPALEVYDGGATVWKYAPVIPSTGLSTGQMLQYTGSAFAMNTMSGDATINGSGALTLSNVTVPKGGTGATTLTSHGVLIGEGTSAVTGITAGTDGQLLVGQSSADPSFKTVSGAVTISKTGVTSPASYMSQFGGNGADGSITISGSTTYSGPLQKNATDFTVSSSKTLTCDTASPIIINSQGAININGTITCTAGSGGLGGKGADGGGAQQYSGGQGQGPGGGNSTYIIGSFAMGGGGGGCGGAGGSTSSNGAIGGRTYLSWLGGGSGGAGGGQQGSGSATGGNGGNGGLCLVLISPAAITLASTGVITNNGSAGTNAGATASGGGGGGGSGGIIWMISQTSVTLTAGGTITCSGGNGGNGSGATSIGGSGGGGGRANLWSPSNTNSSTNTFAGGSAGTGTTGNGGAGSSGTATVITGTPNLPLMTWMGVSLPTNVAEARTYGDGIKYLRGGEINQRELARIYAHGDMNLYAKALTPGFDAEASCELNSDEVLNNVS